MALGTCDCNATKRGRKSLRGKNDVVQRSNIENPCNSISVNLLCYESLHNRVPETSSYDSRRHNDSAAIAMNKRCVVIFVKLVIASS